MKREFKISQFCTWGKELFQIKRKFRGKKIDYVSFMMSCSGSLFKNCLVNVSRFGLGDLFHCLLEDTFCLKYDVRIFKLLSAPIGPKNSTPTPSPSWISTCLFRAKGEPLYTTRGLRFEIKGISWRFKLMVCLISDLIFLFLLLGQRSLWWCQGITMLTANWM